MTQQQMNSNPTYKQPLCTSCAADNESNTTTTRSRDVNETKTTADDTVRCTPQLRFPEFQNAGEWKCDKVKNICKIATGKSNTQDQSSTGKYPFYIRSEKPVRSDKYLYNCEAVITIGDGNIGRVFHYVNGKFDLHQRCYKMTDFHNVIGKYFYYYFSANFYKRAIQLSAKATVDSVRLEMIADMNMCYPSIEEQQKIASCLLSIDDNISATEKELEQLKTHKKALLQKLFPQRGKSIPELRFSEYKDKWKEYTLGGEDGLCEFRNGYTPSKANSAYWINGTIPWYRMEDIRVHGRILSDAIQHITQEAVNGELFEAGSVIISTTATIGEHALLIADSLANQQFTNLKIRKSHKNAVDAYFFYYYCYQISQWCKYNTNSGGLLSVNMDGLKRYKLYIPKDINEQKKIVKCLMEVDTLIDDTERMLKLLLQHKQGLLQQLFPKI